jgi:hypothetical protein
MARDEIFEIANMNAQDENDEVKISKFRSRRISK